MNGDTKTADKIANSDINQNNALEDATSAQNTSNLSDSTVQAFHDTLHFKPLSHTQGSDDATHNNNVIEQNATIDDQRVVDNTVEINKNNNGVGGSDPKTENRALLQGISLKDFEKHHKLMKEANLEKRKLLSSAIEQR